MSHDQEMLIAVGIEAERTRDSRSCEKKFWSLVSGRVKVPSTQG